MPMNMPGKKIRVGGLLLVLLICLFGFRYPIMRGLGQFLIAIDEEQKVTHAFVLSGGAFDRAPKGASLFLNGFADTIVCTGKSIPHDLMAIGIDYSEGEITRRFVVENGVPEGNVKLIEEGTSTLEESEIIYDFCKKNGLTKIAIVSTKFHTRRVRRVFDKKFKDSGIEVLIFGADATSYDEEKWWEGEYGLINFNNEYIKIAYYWLKY